MKKLKLIFATLLSVLFAFTGGKAFADDSTYTLTLDGTTTGHTYEVYQIFAGDVSSDGTTLSNITWGSGVTSFTFNGSSDAATIAESLDGTTDDSATAQSFATTAAANLDTATATVSSTASTTTISGLAAGYYLVKDADDSQSGENSSYTRFILKVVGDALEGAEFTLSKKLADGSLQEVAVVKNTAGTTFTFSGLDDGDYVLSETTTPDGYNKIDDVEFTVTAKHDEDSETPKLTELTGDVTTGSLTFTSSTSAGSLTTDVVNKKGSVLPSTGGMGTTILYVVGTILVLAAGILLVTKKRMDAK